METEETTEIRLLRHWRSGDRGAGDKLLRQYEPLLQSFFSRRVTRNVDELVQRTLLACVQSIDRFEGRSSFKTYLLGIAQNQFLMSLRAEPSARGEPEALSTQPDESPSQLVAIREEQRMLVSALVHMSPEFLRVLQLYYWEGASVEEIAERLAVRPGTVKSRLARARAILKERVSMLNLPSKLRDEMLQELSSPSAAFEE